MGKIAKKKKKRAIYVFPEPNVSYFYLLFNQGSKAKGLLLCMTKKKASYPEKLEPAKVKTNNQEITKIFAN